MFDGNPLSFAALSGAKSPETDGLKKDTSKLIAFYLPQFHRIKENSEWWGDGFTEWTNVVQGKPNFDGHHQPHLPEYFGFYDLSNIDVIRKQAEVAKLFGIHGFCFYHYWFSGRRILERPVDDFLKSDVDIKFCLCWANENWTRTWDGDNKSVLMEQKYALGDDELFIASLVPYLRDRRYITVDEKPMLVVYRAKDMPNPRKSFNRWRELIKDYGFKGLHICVVDFYDISDPAEVDADALVEFPPHKFNGPHNHPDEMPLIKNAEFTGGIVDYTKIIAQSMLRPNPSFKLYRGIIPSWDNTARRQNSPTIVINSSPALYSKWLAYLRAYTRKNLENNENFIFINAWNEWGEGCHLEPDLRWGKSYLESTYRSSFFMSEDESYEEYKVEGIKKIAEMHISSQAISDEEKVIRTQTLFEELIVSNGVDGRAQKISFRLRHYPLIHKIAKWLYMKFK